MQSTGNVSFATSPRSFCLRVLWESPPMMVGLTTKASSPTTYHFDTPSISSLFIIDYGLINATNNIISDNNLRTKANL